jgi:hypothetical protein
MMKKAAEPIAIHAMTAHDTLSARDRINARKRTTESGREIATG